MFLLLLCAPEPIRASEDAGMENKPAQEPFLTVHVSNQKPFSGEEFELTYTIFFKDIAPKIRDIDKPVYQGIWAYDDTPRRLIPSKPEIVNGTAYRSAVIKRMKLVPIESGTLSITGYRLLCFIPKNLSIGTESEPDDSLTLAAPDIAVHVQTLPEPRPADFRGAVGTYSTSVSADRHTLPAGSTLQLTASITGKGSFRTFPEMPFSLPDGFSLIETTAPETASPLPAGSPEKFTSTVTIKAEKQGTFIFAPVTFTAFDPAEQSYKTVTSEKIALTVLPPLPSSSADSPEADVKEESRQPSSLYRLLFALSAVLLPLLYILIKKLRPTRCPGTKKNQNRKSRNQDNKRNSESADSLPELREKLYTVIESCWGMDPRSMTRSELTQGLEKQGIDDTLSKKLLTLLDAIDKLEFAPGKHDEEELEEIRSTCTATIEKLKKK